MPELVYRVPGMNCGNCERAIRHQLSHVEGVESVEIDLEARLVVVRGERLSDTQLRAAIDEAGYEAQTA